MVMAVIKGQGIPGARQDQSLVRMAQASALKEAVASALVIVDATPAPQASAQSSCTGWHMSLGLRSGSR